MTVGFGVVGEAVGYPVSVGANVDDGEADGGVVGEAVGYPVSVGANVYDGAADDGAAVGAPGIRNGSPPPTSVGEAVGPYSSSA